MNFEIVILLSLAACAFALPLPDEEVSTLQKTADVIDEAVTSIVDLVKPEPSSITVEEGTNAVVGNATIENLPKPEIESDLGKPTEGDADSASATESDVQEVPKSLPVVAREETEPAVPPFAGVRAEPKEGVEIGEAKSTALSPDTDELENNTEKKPTGEIQTTTESNVSGSLEKKDETSATEEKPKPEATEDKADSSKPAVAGENKTEDAPTTTTVSKKSETSKPKATDSGKDKHDHSSEANKSEESAESKESEESDESNKSK